MAGDKLHVARLASHVLLSRVHSPPPPQVIQVVAPGDVAFSLSSSDDNSTVMDIFASRSTISNDNSLCMSTAGLAAGLVFLILLLILSCLVAAFLYLRVRQITRTAAHAYACGDTMIACENPEFFKFPGLAALTLTTH